jgi:hypothetical protein
VISVLEEAAEVFIQGLSYREALEYCADPDLTRILERISEDLTHDATAQQ